MLFIWCHSLSKTNCQHIVALFNFRPGAIDPLSRSPPLSSPDHALPFFRSSVQCVILPRYTMSNRFQVVSTTIMYYVFKWHVARHEYIITCTCYIFRLIIITIFGTVNISTISSKKHFYHIEFQFECRVNRILLWTRWYFFTHLIISSFP